LEEDFLSLIATHIEENKPKLSTYEETLILLKQGKTIAEIAELRNLKDVTIYSHIAKLFTDGYSLKIEDYVSQDEINRIQATVENMENTEQLKPIYEALNEEIHYGKIRLTLAFMEQESQVKT
jgi:ATP-dependent DNA helicase RecQ